MKRESLAFLLGGLAFGALLGYGIFHFVEYRPEAQAGSASSDGTVPSPAGPMAATQVGGGASQGAPMLEEINDLKRVLKADPGNARALVRLGNIYQDAAMWSQATGFYEKAIAILPQDPDLLTDTGVCYQQLQQFDKALDYFARAQKANPSHWQSLYNTVIVAGFDLKRLDQAEAALEKLEKVNPQAPNLARLRQELAQARAAAPGGGGRS